VYRGSARLNVVLYVCCRDADGVAAAVTKSWSSLLWNYCPSHFPP